MSRLLEKFLFGNGLRLIRKVGCRWHAFRHDMTVRQVIRGRGEDCLPGVLAASFGFHGWRVAADGSAARGSTLHGGVGCLPRG